MAQQERESNRLLWKDMEKTLNFELHAERQVRRKHWTLNFMLKDKWNERCIDAPEVVIKFLKETMVLETADTNIHSYEISSFC